jgi:hypothetical protein
MCHGYEYEMTRKAYLEQLEKRNREREEALKKQSGTVAPARPAETPPRVKDKQPVPA